MSTSISSPSGMSHTGNKSSSKVRLEISTSTSACTTPHPHHHHPAHSQHRNTSSVHDTHGQPRLVAHSQSPAGAGAGGSAIWHGTVHSPVFRAHDESPSTVTSPTSALSTPMVQTPTSPSWWHHPPHSHPASSASPRKRGATFSMAARLVGVSDKTKGLVQRLRRETNAQYHSTEDAYDEREREDVPEDGGQGQGPLVTSFGAYRLRLD